MRFARGDVRGPYRFIQNRSRAFVVELKGDTAATVLMHRSKQHRYSIPSSARTTRLTRAKGPPPVSLRPALPLMKKLPRNRWEQQ